MEIVRTLDAPVPPERLFALVDDLAVYPSWMPLVHDVDLVRDVDEATAGAGRAWEVELRATVGPFARSKRLRMVRTEHAAPERVVFERAELDGRAHAPWVLRATVSPREGSGASTLTMSLHYGGSLWTGAALQRVLDHDVDRGRANLLALLSSEPTR
jgi:uncharacterized protein YndB with AHSA1/START domain